MTNTQTNVPVSETQLIAFNKLVEDPNNVRKTRSDDSIKSLAENIKAEGLLQNLVVRRTRGGKFAVVGGERRRRALALLVSNSDMAASDGVPCKLVGKDSVSASLSENIHREAMHPADQFEAWALMADQGLSVSEIATRHGATPKLIEQRLKLGRLSSVILDALRANEIDIDTATAFTITDDQEQQNSVYEALKSQYYGISAHTVRNALTKDEVASTNKLAKLVGREAYEAAGGEIRTDLFGDTVYFKDADLLTRLAIAKLEDEAERLKSVGWLWIDFAFDYDYQAGNKMRRIQQQKVKLTEEDQTEFDALKARMAEVEDAAQQDDEQAIAEYEEIEGKLAILEAKTKAYRPKQQVIAGGFLSITHNGEIDINLGFIRPEDDPKVAAEKKKAAKSKADQPHGYTNSLRDDLAAIRMEVLQTEFLANPWIARDLVGFHTVRDALSSGFTQTPFDMTAKTATGARTASKQGDMGIYEGRKRVENMVSHLSLDWFEIEDMAESFSAYCELSEQAKASLLAYAAAHMLKPQLNDESQTVPSLERAAEMMQVDVASYWTPTKDFFNRLTKGHMMDIAKTVISPTYAQAREKHKKGEYAEALGNAFDPSVNNPSVDQAAAGRIASWVPECMTVTPPAPVEADKAA